MFAELEAMVYHRTLASVLTGCLTERAHPTAFRPPLLDCACETPILETDPLPKIELSGTGTRKVADID